jgi:hypothetical protein
MTLVGASYFLHFLNNLQAISLLDKLVVESLVHFMTIPWFPLFFPNYAFTIYEISFSRDLFSRYSSGCAPQVGNPVTLEIKEISIGTIMLIHMIPPCTLAKSYLKQRTTFFYHT